MSYSRFTSIKYWARQLHLQGKPFFLPTLSPVFQYKSQSLSFSLSVYFVFVCGCRRGLILLLRWRGPSRPRRFSTISAPCEQNCNWSHRPRRQRWSRLTSSAAARDLDTPASCRYGPRLDRYGAAPGRASAPGGLQERIAS